MTGAGLGRLLAPRHIAVVGGDAAATAIRQSRRLGYEGEIWPVNERRSRIEGLRCFTDIGSLPEAPDAALVAVHRESATAVIGDLAKHGAGGAVCHAAGFAESGAYGAELQQSLVD
ncbi:MAG TPA: CoA-binding protein, partial [Nocardioidaceae bacterium]|nr:CoA-binding protein [Nocardioidaceae bacterium]